MAVTGYESLVGLLISRWVSRKLLPRAFQRRSRALRRMSDCVKQKERGRMKEEVVKWVIGSRVKAKLDIPRKIISARMTMIEFSRIIRPSHPWWKIREWMRCNVALIARCIMQRLAWKCSWELVEVMKGAADALGGDVAYFSERGITWKCMDVRIYMYRGLESS